MMKNNCSLNYNYQNCHHFHLRHHRRLKSYLNLLPRIHHRCNHDEGELHTLCIPNRHHIH